MIYHVRTGSINTTQVAHSHKQAALKTLSRFEDFGQFVIVGLGDLDDESTHSSMMFFHTDSLLTASKESESNMKLVY